MTPSPTFDRVYAEIRQRVLSAAWFPGQRIELPHLTDELNASTTPVRDALNRLVGERLLVRGANDGFAMPSITEPDLRDLYDWTHQLMMLAIRHRRDGPIFFTDQDDPSADIATRTAKLLAAIAARSGNADLQFAVEMSNARLHAARLAEAKIFSDDDVELADLRNALTEDHSAALRSQLMAYHRRRVAAAGRIVQLLHRPDR